MSITNAAGTKFDDCYVPEPNSGCWLWDRGIDGKGYGIFYLGNKGHRAHRIAYEALVGKIPSGLVIDHKCRNIICVNPAHLEPVTQRTNVLRGNGMAGRHARRTECPRGHKYEINGTASRAAKGWRECKQCRTNLRRAKASLRCEGRVA